MDVRFVSHRHWLGLVLALCLTFFVDQAAALLDSEVTVRSTIYDVNSGKWYSYIQASRSVSWLEAWRYTHSARSSVFAGADVAEVRDAGVSGWIGQQAKETTGGAWVGALRLGGGSWEWWDQGRGHGKPRKDVADGYLPDGFDLSTFGSDLGGADGCAVVNGDYDWEAKSCASGSFETAGSFVVEHSVPPTGITIPVTPVPIPPTASLLVAAGLVLGLFRRKIANTLKSSNLTLA